MTLYHILRNFAKKLAFQHYPVWFRMILIRHLMCTLPSENNTSFLFFLPAPVINPQKKNAPLSGSILLLWINLQQLL